MHKWTGRLTETTCADCLARGTCNDFSRTLNIQQNLQKAAKELVSNGEEEAVDIVQTDSAYFLNFWGIGIVAETSNNIREEEKNVLGKASYVLSAIRTIQNTEPKELVMNIDGKEIREKAVLAIVVNGNYIGGNDCHSPFPIMMEWLMFSLSGIQIFS